MKNYLFKYFFAALYKFLHLRYYLFFILVIFSCTKKGTFKPDEPIVTVEAQVIHDVAYGGDKQQKMDVYLPGDRSVSSTKVFVFVHGGAWGEGDKADSTNKKIIDSLRRRLPDWAIFNLNYRLVKYKFPLSVDNKFPTQEDDIKSAIKYIYDRRGSFIISDKWVLAGASAGGHLAMLQAYKNSDLLKPKAVVDLFGPTDMKALYNYFSKADPGTATLISLMMNGNPDKNPSLYASSSPINYVSAESPPTIILQGGLDDAVPKEQSFTLSDKLQSYNVTHQFVYYDNQTHGWSDPVVVNDSYNKIVTFLNANVP